MGGDQTADEGAAGTAAEAEAACRDRFADLVERVATAQDRAAFIALFDHFGPRLNAYLRRLGTDNGSAEEIVQEVMVVLWRKAALFDRSKSSVATWLFRIARNRRIDMARRDRSKTLDPSDSLLQPSPAEDPSEAVDGRRREARVAAALAGLPPEQRTLVRLAFFQELSHGEIAAATGLPLGTVKSRIRLAFGRLRKALEQTGETESP